MTTEAKDKASSPTTPPREPRPFLRLEAIDVPRKLPPSARQGLPLLAGLLMDDVAALVRSLVNHTVAVQNEERRRRGRPEGVTLSVLNRRRRAARSWILTILAGQVDRGSLHAITRSWLPQLCGTGPGIRNAVEPAARYVEFLRGLMTGLVVRRVAENLVPEAKALHALETVLGIHLGAMEEAANAEARRNADS